MSEAPATAPIALMARGLTMRFGGLTAVSELDLVAQSGKVTSLIGPNGAGKTTAFNCITGFYKPTSGEIALQVGDEPARRIDTLPGHRVVTDAKVVRTFQNTRLFAGMTVLENLMVAQHGSMSRSGLLQIQGLFGLPAYKRAEQAAVEKAMFWLERLGLAARADDYAGELPYGLQRRLEIARAMCLDPRFLCLDEPAAGLNPRESALLESDLRLLAKEDGIGVLLIEHDMSVVMGVSDHLIVLDRGKKIAEGLPEAVRGDRAVIAAYLGEPADSARVRAPPARAPSTDATPAAAAAPMLECRKLSSGYGKIAVLRDIDIHVGEGEIVALLGANGAGKSTLLRTLFGMPRATGGEILLGGRPIQRLRPHEVARLGVAHVPEGRRIMPQMTVRENLKTGSQLGSGAEFDADLAKVLELFPRLAERLTQRAGLMSGGEQQMLAIGRAMMQRPKLLVLDEPSLGLAPLVIRLIFDAICQLNEREGLTVLLVEQNVAQALAISDRGYVLQTGRVVSEGSAETLAAQLEVPGAYL